MLLKYFLVATFMSGTFGFTSLNILSRDDLSKLNHSEILDWSNNFLHRLEIPADDIDVRETKRAFTKFHKDVYNFVTSPMYKPYTNKYITSAFHLVSPLVRLFPVSDITELALIISKDPTFANYTSMVDNADSQELMGIGRSAIVTILNATIEYIAEGDFGLLELLIFDPCTLVMRSRIEPYQKTGGIKMLRKTENPAVEAWIERLAIRDQCVSSPSPTELIEVLQVFTTVQQRVYEFVTSADYFYLSVIFSDSFLPEVITRFVKRDLFGELLYLDDILTRGDSDFRELLDEFKNADVKKVVGNLVEMIVLQVQFSLGGNSVLSEGSDRCASFFKGINNV